MRMFMRENCHLLFNEMFMKLTISIREMLK
jgi:hypothetical protein